MKITQMRRKDFLTLPVKDAFKEDIGEYKSLVIIPTGKMHDSGFQIMHFVPVNENEEPICRICGCSDVIEIDGTGGCGELKPFQPIPDCPPLNAWRIDCLPCGYLRMFCRGNMANSYPVSSFEVFGRKDNAHERTSNQES